MTTHTTSTYVVQGTNAEKVMDAAISITPPETLIYHTLTVTFRDNRVRLGLVCHAPERAACRLVCAEGCETWNVHSHEHPLVTDECSAVLWMQNEEEEYCKGPDNFPMHHGMPVSIEWAGDTYVWSPILLPG